MTLRPALRHRLRPASPRLGGQGEQAQGIQERVKIIKNMIMAKRIELKIYGEVQGVFFRAQAKKIADELGLTGYVENKSDNTVKIIAEGGEKELKNLIERCYNFKSSESETKNCSRRDTIPSAVIEKINVEWKEARGEFEGFEIKYQN